MELWKESRLEGFPGNGQGEPQLPMWTLHPEALPTCQAHGGGLRAVPVALWDYWGWGSLPTPLRTSKELEHSC